MIDVPMLIPVTAPDEEPTVATVSLDELHVPPPMASVSVIVAPDGTVDGPEIGAGVVTTVIVVVVKQPEASR
jgi:hypothetical protein